MQESNVQNKTSINTKGCTTMEKKYFANKRIESQAGQKIKSKTKEYKKQEANIMTGTALINKSNRNPKRDRAIETAQRQAQQNNMIQLKKI